MSGRNQKPGLGRLLSIVLTVAALGAIAGPLIARYAQAPWTPPAPDYAPLSVRPTSEASAADVERTCGACHRVPTPDLFPRERWRSEVERGYRFLWDSDLDIQAASMPSVVRYYEERAPERFPAIETPARDLPGRFEFQWRPIPGPKAPVASAVSNLQLARLEDPDRLDALVCDMAHGLVMLGRLEESAPSWRILSDQIAHPARATVTDLDGDGCDDLLVAELGVPMPSDAKRGAVVWLHSEADGSYSTHTLASGLGRVADIQAADFDLDGDLDLVVAVFGWLKVGSILHFENVSTTPERPEFRTTVLDDRHGTIRVPVTDLDGDGRPDFVALISQEHETVVAFLNRGAGRFERRTVFEAPHPAFGSSGMELVDLDGDGDLDVLVTSGDVYDSVLMKPYHGVYWLENHGTYPFEPHRLTSLYGAHRAQAADLDGDGDQDIVATSFLVEALYEEQRRELGVDSVIVLEQTRPGEFQRHSLQTIHCDYATFDVGDVDGDDRPEIVLGTFRIFGPKDYKDRSGADGRPNAVIVLERPNDRPPHENEKAASTPRETLRTSDDHGRTDISDRVAPDS